VLSDESNHQYSKLDYILHYFHVSFHTLLADATDAPRWGNIDVLLILYDFCAAYSYKMLINDINILLADRCSKI
jgi:hypothetical protein